MDNTRNNIHAHGKAKLLHLFRGENKLPFQISKNFQLYNYKNYRKFN